MKKIVYRKSLVIVIILFFIYSGFASGTNIQIINKNNVLSYGRGNTLYVGGNGSGNYSNIQEAIYNSNNGDTIFVYNGVYPADIVIDKSVILLGEDKDKTIIQGGQDGFLINVDGVSIKNFTITGCGQFWNHYAIRVTTNDNVIKNNKIISNGKLNGIFIGYSTNNLISENNISNNPYFGIRLEYANYNVIINNYVGENEAFGVVLSESFNNTFISNTVTSNLWGGFSVFENCENNIFYHNNVINNDVYPWDSGINIWNNNYPSGGNYWTEYIGSDNFQGPNQDIPGSDGIGDTPYNIPGGSNYDLYPLMKPYGFPDTPIITGPTKSKLNEINEYTFIAIDPDNDSIYYYIDWGDGITLDWQGPYLSGESYQASHSWSNKGTFTIKCKVKDIYGAESSWGYLNIVVPRTRVAFNIIIERFFFNNPFLQKLLNKIR